MSTEEQKVAVQQPEQAQPEQTQPEATQQPAKPKKEKVEKPKKERAVPQVPARAVVIVDNPLEAEFGDYKLIDSSLKTGRVFTEIADITPENAGKQVWVRARAQTIRGKGKNAFFQLRQQFLTCQACIFASENGPSVDCAKYAGKIPAESIIDVFGTIVEAEVNSCTQKKAEIAVSKVFVVTASAPRLPFQVLDASRHDPTYTGLQTDADKGGDDAVTAEGEKFVRVSQDTRLDNRWIDLRTPANQAIFRVQSRIGQFFRQYLIDRDFMEIHTPKITPGSSEGGAQVFTLDYFGTKCCLAQSPQLYKQMATVSDFGKVFEIGHVFRAENSNTHRHLCEFTGLDLEMEFKEDYHEVLDLIGDMLVYIFNKLNETCQREMAAVNDQYPFTPLRYQEKCVTITFSEAHQMLVDAGVEHGEFDDMSTAQERKLGELMLEKYGAELYIVDRFPSSIRPFYTMPAPDDARWSNSYDIFLRGEEISSGAQRIHDPELLVKRATECGIPIPSLQAYIDSFKYGAVPHAGCGLGLERFTFLFLGLKNIRLSTLFPRDPKRNFP